MASVKSLLTDNGRVYVYLADEATAARFLLDAQSEGFSFCDGAKPTERKASDLYAINGDMTISFVGTVGRIAYQSADSVDGQPLIKIDYRDIIGN